MGGSSTTESEDGLFSTDSPLNNDCNNLGEHLNGSGIVLKKGPWTSAEDAILVDYVKKHGEGNWNAVQKQSGLSRCGKSCRLRWANHLRPNLKKGAFTPEEERLIIELHAKMGNKWARMAAHLPGRTDNEIKNYWNTRIKRRQRAGLPLYPPDVCLHAQPENQQQITSPGIFGDNECHEVIQNNDYGTLDNIFDSFDILPKAPEFYGISGCASKGNGYSTQIYSFLSQTIGMPKFIQESDETMADYDRGFANEALLFEWPQTDGCINKMPLSLGPRFIYGSDHMEKLLPFGANQDSHMSNVFFSASKPISGAQKLELPSLQYPETSFGLWDPSSESMDPIVHSPSLSLSGPFSSSHCPSPGSSGLLEDLVYEANALSHQSSDWATSSNFSHWDSSAFKTCLTDIKDHLDPGSPSACDVKPEVVSESWILNAESVKVQDDVECCRPDAILGSCGGWIGRSVRPLSCSMPTNGIPGDGNMCANHGIKSSCFWNNMPPVHQVSNISSALRNF